MYKLRLARRMLMLSSLAMGSVYASSCSMRDLRDAAISGGLGFVSDSVAASLGLLFPFVDLLALLVPNVSA